MQPRLFTPTTDTTPPASVEPRSQESKDHVDTPISAEEKLIGLLLKETAGQYHSFVKPGDHFTEAKEYALTDGNPSHSAVFFTKKNKQDTWLGITSGKIKTEELPTNCRFITFMGDIMRQEMGSLAPKYRYVTYPDGTIKLLSKKIDGLNYLHFLMTYIAKHIKFHTYLEEQGRYIGDYLGPAWFEGVCTSTYLKLLYNDDDLHWGNLFIVNIGGLAIAVPFDLDRCLWPLPVAFFNEKHSELRNITLPKRMQYLSDHPDAICSIDRIAGTELSILHHTTGAQNGELTERDLVRLPIIQDKLPNNYQFMNQNVRPFSEAVDQSVVGKNEVNYHRLKTYLLTFLTRYKRAYHFEREEQFVAFGKKVEKELNAIHATVRELTHTSDALREYVAKNWDFIKAIIYDMNTDFYDNHHYQPQNKLVWQQAWNTMVDLVIDKFNELLKIYGLVRLNATEIEQLKKFAELCENNYSEACKTAVSFYESQERFAFAESERVMLADRLKSRAKRFVSKEAAAEPQKVSQRPM